MKYFYNFIPIYIYYLPTLSKMENTTTTTTTNFMTNFDLIGKTVIFKTKRKNMNDNSLIPIFPEHTFSACIVDVFGNFVRIKDIKLLLSESNINRKYARELTLLGRDKLFSNMSNYNEIDKTCLIKITNNLYFDIDIYSQNTDLLQSIQNHNWFPLLYNICFYNLSTTEMNFTRELFCYNSC